MVDGGVRADKGTATLCARPFPDNPQEPMAVPIRTLANAIRALAMDAVEAANSGHPGMPMGMADAATEWRCASSPSRQATL